MSSFRMGSAMNRVLLEAARLRKICERLDVAASDDDEWLPANAVVPFQWYPSKLKSECTVYVTKWNWALGYISPQPGRTSFLARPGRIDERLLGAVLGKCRGERVVFVGDLDPLDLLVFASVHAAARSCGIACEYRGVDSRWMAVCERASKRIGRTVPYLPMSRLEVLCWDLLKDEKWAAVLGRQAIARLEEGKKLELEGASNPVFYGSGIARTVRTRLP